MLIYMYLCLLCILHEACAWIIFIFCPHPTYISKPTHPPTHQQNPTGAAPRPLPLLRGGRGLRRQQRQQQQQRGRLRPAVLRPALAGPRLWRPAGVPVYPPLAPRDRAGVRAAAVHVVPGAVERDPPRVDDGGQRPIPLGLPHGGGHRAGLLYVLYMIYIYISCVGRVCGVWILVGGTKCGVFWCFFFAVVLCVVGALYFWFLGV